MKKANKFYTWFTKMGGNVSFLDVEKIYNTVNEVNLQVSTLKSRAKEIKEKYNYKFN